MLKLLFPLLLALPLPFTSALPHNDLSPRQLLCTSQSRPNPIASTYPNKVTGTINGTLALLPIPLALAQQIVGAQHPILVSAYRSLLPDFPPDTYPALLQAVFDHDVQSSGVRVPDFSRISIEYPFVSLSAGSTTPLRLVPDQTLSATAVIALAGSAAYGTRVHPAVFDPPCDGYAADGGGGATRLDAYGLDGEVAFRTRFTTTAEEEEGWPLEFWVNVTNQLSFAEEGARGCDRMTRFFDTSVTTEGGVVPVRGEVWAGEAGFPGGRRWEEVRGVRVDTAFIEENFVGCE